MCKEDGGREVSKKIIVNFKIHDFIYLIDVLNTVFVKVIANKPNCTVKKKFLHLFTLFNFFFLFEPGWVETL